MPRATRNKKAFQAFIEQRWYGKPGWLYLLAPLEWLFKRAARLRKSQQTRRQTALPVPVIVIGNIAVGGTGKTPIVKAIIRWLQQQGYRPGVVSRGYGRASRGVLSVARHPDAQSVGDEPLEIHLATAAPVVVGEDRLAAAQTLLREYDCNVIVSDDGLQHYRLPRDLEIAVVDAGNLFGNGHCLPVGPLREPIARLASVGAVLTSGEQPIKLNHPVAQYCFSVVPMALVNVKTGEQRACCYFNEVASWVAIAGIGRPEKFFETLYALRASGLPPLEQRAFSDHHHYAVGDFQAFAQKNLIMTEKDAVKCARFAASNWWYLQIEAQLPAAFYAQLSAILP